MNWTTLICFGAGIGLYLVGLGIFTLIKRSKNKKKFKKEIEEHEQKEQQSKMENQPSEVPSPETKEQ